MFRNNVKLRKQHMTLTTPQLREHRYKDTNEEKYKETTNILVAVFFWVVRFWEFFKIYFSVFIFSRVLLSHFFYNYDKT